MEHNVSEHWEQILSIAGLLMLGLISPGPDFNMIARNSLIYSRRVGVFTALGIALGTIIHVSAIFLGIGALIAETPLFLTIIKYLGASYLIYIGYRGIRTKKSSISSLGNLEHMKDISSFSALKIGFLTNILNPKAMLFFIGLFSLVISPDIPVYMMYIYIFICVIETLLWFSFVAICLSGKSQRAKFRSISHWIERVTGMVAMSFGVKLILMEI